MITALDAEITRRKAIGQPDPSNRNRNSLTNTVENTFPLRQETYNVLRDLIADLGAKNIPTVAPLGDDGFWRKMIVYFNGHKRLANPEFSGNYPAIFADETKSFYAGESDEVTRNLRLRSYILTVGALQGPIKASKTSFDSILPKEWYRAYDSNACGNTKARCLFVPISSHHAGGEPHLFQGIPVSQHRKKRQGLRRSRAKPKSTRLRLRGFCGHSVHHLAGAILQRNQPAIQRTRRRPRPARHHLRTQKKACAAKPVASLVN